MYLELLLLAIALVGHLAISATLLSQTLATAMPLWANKILERGVQCWMALAPFAVIAWGTRHPLYWDASADWQRLPPVLAIYLLGCLVAGPLFAIVTIWRKLTSSVPSVWRSTSQCTVDIRSEFPTPPVRGAVRRALTYLPGNGVLSIDRNEKVLEVPRLDRRLHGLTIAHFSDLHLEGTVDKAYFRYAVEIIQEMQADLVALTGDIVDRAEQIDWLPEIFAPLRTHGRAYFILGNHDLKARDLAKVRRVLTEAGLQDLGGLWKEIQIRGQSVVIAGDELPWIPPAVDLSKCPPASSRGGPLRILVAHTPDRYRWARSQEFDLMLAGHTHGGQVCLPGIGPVVSPCRQGVRYAAGLFYEPPTILHVSRGLSETFPVRLGCPPELTRLVLHARLCGADHSEAGAQVPVHNCADRDDSEAFSAVTVPDEQ
ncbi:MAG: metallophosphoesterase [Pirellulales bacterium]|nr:metallophosphoesterase [Pirellulales bacterium]